MLSLSVNIRVFAQTTSNFDLSGRVSFAPGAFSYARSNGLFTQGTNPPNRPHTNTQTVGNCDLNPDLLVSVVVNHYSGVVNSDREHRFNFKLIKIGEGQIGATRVSTGKIVQGFTPISPWVVTTETAVYQLRVDIDRKNIFGIWNNNAATVFSSPIYLNVPVTPNFTVNGVSAPNNSQPVQICSSLLGNNQVNTADFQCEKDYFMSIEECDLWWGRSFENEWFFSQNSTLPTTAFSLGAIHNLVSVPISTTPVGSNSFYPIYPNILGGTTTGNFNLQGGIIPSGPNAGQARYYRYSIGSVTYPGQWNVRTILLQILDGCMVMPDQLEESVLPPFVEKEFVVNIPDYLMENQSEVEAINQMRTFEYEIEEMKMLVRPNPVSYNGFVTLNIVESEKYTLQILDNTGKLINSVFTLDYLQPGIYDFNLNVGNLASGLYFIRLSSNKGVITQKLIVQ